MVQRIAGRLVQSIMVVLVASVIIFMLGRMLGDPIALLLPPEATRADIANLRAHLGLDDPLPTQYWRFASNAVRGDFGRSIINRKPVIELMGDRFPATARLALVAFVLGYAVSIPLGIISAYRYRTWIDTVVNTIAALGQSVPSFFFGILLITLFSVKFQLLPAAGQGNLLNYVMPGATIMWLSLAGTTRIVRSSMLDVLSSDYIRTARAKGLSEPAVVLRHGFRNALIPLMGLSGLQFAALLTGTVVVETVFAWPGVGRLAYQGIITRDYPVIQALTLTATTVVVFVNLIIDILYSWADPRIRGV
ncbi:MAG: ABC transporter permease [Dehalococcoidia bacterium]|nr:ABC transporter permease [Dehalococcoidia bacterium]